MIINKKNCSIEPRLKGLVVIVENHFKNWGKKKILKLNDDIANAIHKFKQIMDKNNQLTDIEILSMDLYCHYEPSKSIMTPWIDELVKLSIRKNKKINLSNLALSLFILENLRQGKSSEAQKAYQLLITKKTFTRKDG